MRVKQRFGARHGVDVHRLRRPGLYAADDDAPEWLFEPAVKDKVGDEIATVLSAVWRTDGAAPLGGDAPFVVHLVGRSDKVQDPMA